MIVSLQLALSGCGVQQPNLLTAPDFGDRSELIGLPALTDLQAARLEGIYEIEGQGELLGKTAVLRARRGGISIFTGKTYSYLALKGGVRGQEVVLEGHWRAPFTTELGLTRLTVAEGEGGSAVLGGANADTSTTLRGRLGSGSEDPQDVITLRYQRAIGPSSDALRIVAHRGGGRNADRLPHAENSLGLLRLAEIFGADGVELDVRITTDGVPVLFHDENFSPRLVKGEFCLGPVAKYSYRHIEAFCELKNGEEVPKLEDALRTIVDETGLRLVWLDVKDPGAVAAVLALQKRFLMEADSKGRSLEILFGLPTEEVVQAFQAEPSHTGAVSLCELTPARVRELDARIWAPRWTLGPQREEAERLRAEGRKTFVWTLDQGEFIQAFLEEGAIDGLVTNYPSVAAYLYYVR
ncbi:MAG: glycerophosphodiester phosphodiesterase [Oligoflexia bacterium]|nr:glycerophosphodiester phosphodiesterase [Oligoflexia bacterium]